MPDSSALVEPVAVLRPLLALLALLHTAPLRAEPTLPPPLALGGECRLLVPCPWSGPLAAHLRLGVVVWLGQDGDPRPVSVVPSAALSVSLWRWAEAGAVFSARGGASQDGGPALLQLPITLWARLSPQLGADEGIAVAAEVRYAVGRAPFDAAGTIYGDSESYGLSAGYRKHRIEAFLSGAYQEAGDRSYRGFEVGGGLYILALRSLGLQIGAEALSRIGGEGGAAAPAWTAVAALRFADEHGVTGTLGYTAGGGAGMPRQGPAFLFGLSFGPDYRPHEKERGYDPLLPWFEDWIGQRLRRLFAPRPPALLPPLQLAPPVPAPPDQPAYCMSLPPRLLPPQVLRGCVVAPYALRLAPDRDRVLADVLAQGRGSSPTAGPAAPEVPYGPPRPPILAGGGPPRPPGRGMPRTGLRTSRGTGWEDADGRGGAEPPTRPPTFWTTGRPGGPTMGSTAEPPPPPSIPIRPQPPLPLPPGVRPESVPPFLRPAVPTAPHAEQATPAQQAPTRGGAGPVRQGQRGVAEYNEAGLREGRKFVGEEVTFETSYGRRRADVIEIDPATGEPIAVEVKTGQSRYTRAQRAKDQELAEGRGRGVGPRAERAGVAGPIKLQTKVVRLPSVKEP